MGKNKKIVSILIASLLLGLIFPLSIARAQWPDVLGWINDNAVKPITTGITYVIASSLTAIGSYLLEVMQGFLGWVISSDFIHVSMTGPDNPFVTLGWGITRDLANIILVLGLVIIALGIILGMEEYQAKKTLPVLIIIALLVNFTPVICGLIIDFSNILMNYFLKGGLSSGFSDAVLSGMNSNIVSGDPVRALATSVIYFIFAMVGVIIYFLYALLFAARYIFLWILVIVSPIAFVSRVFPQSKYIQKFFPSFFYWNAWWDSFIQWCVIGIYGGFFIFLANQIMVLMVSGAKFTSEPTGTPSVFGNLFGYLLPILLLLIGFFTTIEAAEQGIKVIPGMEKAGRKVIEGVGVAGAGALGAGVGAMKGEEAMGAMKKAREEGKGFWRTAGAGIKGYAKDVGRGAGGGGRAEVKRTLTGWAGRIPIAGRAIGGPAAGEKAHQEKIGKARERLKGLPDNPAGNGELQRIIDMTPITEEDHYSRLVAMELLGQRKEVNEDFVKAHVAEYEKAGMDPMAILKARPDLSNYFHITENGVERRRTEEETLAKIEPGELPKVLQKDAVTIDYKKMSDEQIQRVSRVLYAIGKDRKKLDRLKRGKLDLRKRFKNNWEELIKRSGPMTQEQIDTVSAIEDEFADNPEWQF